MPSATGPKLILDLAGAGLASGGWPCTGCGEFSNTHMAGSGNQCIVTSGCISVLDAMLARQCNVTLSHLPTRQGLSLITQLPWESQQIRFVGVKRAKNLQQCFACVVLAHELHTVLCFESKPRLRNQPKNV